MSRMNPAASSRTIAFSVCLVLAILLSGEKPRAEAGRTDAASPSPQEGYGTLKINTTPPTKVYVDGRYHGITPLLRIRLKAGLHKLRLTNWRHDINKTFQIKIKAGKSLTFIKRFD